MRCFRGEHQAETVSILFQVSRACPGVFPQYRYLHTVRGPRAEENVAGYPRQVWGGPSGLSALGRGRAGPGVSLHTVKLSRVSKECLFSAVF